MALLSNTQHKNWSLTFFPRMFLKKCSSIREFDYADLDIGKGCKLVISFSLEHILHLLTELFLEHSQQFGNTVTLTNGCVKLPSILLLRSSISKPKNKIYILWRKRKLIFWWILFDESNWRNTTITLPYLCLNTDTLVSFST